MLSRREFLGGAAASLAAAEKRPPNILLLLPDQHRFDWTSFNQDLEIRTPHLDRLAREGMRFTQALVASPLCAPSVARSDPASHSASIPTAPTTVERRSASAAVSMSSD